MCEMLDNPNEGFSHFDRIGPAIVTIAQVLTRSKVEVTGLPRS
jgi:hypothetical protein